MVEKFVISYWPFFLPLNLLDILLTIFVIVCKRELDFEDPTEKSNGSLDKDAIAQRLQEIYKRLDAIDVYSAEARAASILAVSSQTFLLLG